MRRRSSSDENTLVEIQYVPYAECDAGQRQAWDWLWRWLLGPGPAPQPTPAPATTAAVPGRSNAPAGETPGASTDTSTVTSSAKDKQGAHDDTIWSHE